MKKKKAIIIVTIITICCLLVIWKVTISKKDIMIYQSSSDQVFIVKGKKKVKTSIKDIDSSIIINNKYLVYSNNGHLYLYHGNTQKKKIISKNYQALIDYNTDNIIYATTNHIFLYNLKHNNYQKIDNTNDIKFSKNNNNLIYRKNNQLIVYNILKKKEMIKADNIEQYECIDKSCMKFYFLRSGKLYYYDKKEKDLKINATNILWQKNFSIIYQTQHEGEYTLYYKNGNKNPVKLDTNKRPHKEVKMNHNKIVYLSGGNCKEIKKNGKNRKIIARSIEKIIDFYQDKYLLIKNNSLYLNDVLISDKVNSDSIIVKGKKIYYLQSHKDINWLIEKTNKKENILNKNVIKIIDKEDNVYYLGDYNLYRKYGNVFSIKNNKKKLDEKIKDIK